MEQKIKRLLPRKNREKGASQVQKIKSLLFSFALGNDSLSDLDDLREDPLFCELIGKEVAARTMGDFLKSFGGRHVERFQDYLIDMGFELRQSLFPEDKKFILTMDSPPTNTSPRRWRG